MYIAVHVHHFLYYKLCWAVDIFQNFCPPVATPAVINFLSKSETAWKWFSIHVRQMVFDVRPVVTLLISAWMVSSSCIFASSSFFELSQFEQLNISLLNLSFFGVGVRRSNFRRSNQEIKSFLSGDQRYCKNYQEIKSLKISHRCNFFFFFFF